MYKVGYVKKASDQWFIYGMGLTKKLATQDLNKKIDQLHPDEFSKIKAQLWYKEELIQYACSHTKICSCGAFLTVDEIKNLRPWPETDFSIGECPHCASSLAIKMINKKKFALRTA